MRVLNEYQQQNFENTQVFARELSAFYPTVAQLQDDVTNGPLVLLTRNGKQYQVNKDYRGYITVHAWPYRIYDNVHHTTRGDIYRKHETNNMKVLSKKKLDAKLDACDAIENEMHELNIKAIAKREAYIEKIKACGVPVDWMYNYTTNERHERVRGEITGGYIDRGNLRFKFEFHNDGYTSENVTIIKNYQLGLDGFLAMSDNHYIDHE